MTFSSMYYTVVDGFFTDAARRRLYVLDVALLLSLLPRRRVYTLYALGGLA